MSKKVIIAGGTGFIGQYIAEQYKTLGYQVFIISRSSRYLQWEDEASIVNALEGAELLINLAGKSVNCRYHYKNKWKILTSRTQSTIRLHKYISQCKTPPKKWLNSSTATIYRHAEDRPMTEDNGEIGTGFSVHVAETWEHTFFGQQHEGVQQIAMRTAIVMGNGGALTPIKNLVKMGFGGKQGSGEQMVSWIHIEDLFRIIRYLEAHEIPQKIYNCSSPNPINNEEFMKTVRHSLHVRRGLSTPAMLLKIGAVLIRTEPEMVLKSRWVLPERLLNEGFEFKFLKIEEALGEL